MDFSCFIKKVRNELSLSQNEMVDKLASSRKQLCNLNITTYNRWENGHTTPSETKVYFIIKALNLDLIKSYKTLDLKHSKSKIKKFKELIQYLDSNQNRFRLLSSSLPNFEKFKIFGENNPSDDAMLLSKLKGSINNFVSQSVTDVNKKDLENFREMQKSGTMTVAVCKAQERNIYSSHGAWIYIDILKEKEFITSFKNRSFRLRKLNPASPKKNSFIFIIPPSLHSSTWNHYFTSELIKGTLKRQPERIYGVCLSFEALRLYLNVGFKTITSVKNKIIVNCNIDTQDDFSNTYLLAIEYDEFISHPGIIKFIKESELFS
ncbi:helix-turn-helix transcriptional regulator [Vibrio alginolyticus]|uniref:helix-turn-helix transcriptional regulator n=1 Tax=Vibrio alginolyticus TaxID=663 RepID=UPI00215F444A|nr:helix-turn-helix transcriptional regulator [Vibrio alginolyticus]MCS0290194.1 helix-turn-helix domain-containing protein [Vibrio alginolyticus]